MPRCTLITGGAGFIGSHLAHRLHERGDDVLIIDDLSTGREENIAGLLGESCRLIKGRVSEVLRQEPGVLQGVSQVYHLAASVGVQLVVKDPAAIIRNNTEETAALFEAVREGGATVLVASSSEVYGKNNVVPLREDADLIFGPSTQPRWSYAISKAIDEHLALAACGFARPRHIVVRLFNTIGPRQVGHYGMVVPRFVQAAVRGQDLTLYGDGQQTRAFCDVRDVVSAMTALMENEGSRGQIFNIGSEEEITIDALADKVIALASGNGGAVRSRKRLVPFDEAYAPGFEDPFRRRVPDVSKLRAVIGWQRQYTLDATVRELIEIGCAP